jgi:sugar O-acyltransferase (sialic acid O-acetyltransferase NeuD family)
MSKKQDIILVGGGGHCKSCIDVIEQEGIYSIAGIIDVKSKIGEKILGYTIIGSDDDIGSLSKEYKNFVITLGFIRNSELRIKLYNTLNDLGVNLPAIISPIAYVSKHAKIGAGTFIMHHSVVNAGAEVKDNCIINTKALIEHDSVIHSHCHISTAAVINGGVEVGEATFYGSGSVCRQFIKIKENSFIKANSIVKC